MGSLGAVWGRTVPVGGHRRPPPFSIPAVAALTQQKSSWCACGSEKPCLRENRHVLLTSHPQTPGTPHVAADRACCAVAAVQAHSAAFAPHPRASRQLDAPVNRSCGGAQGCSVATAAAWCDSPTAPPRPLTAHAPGGGGGSGSWSAGRRRAPPSAWNASVMRACSPSALLAALLSLSFGVSLPAWSVTSLTRAQAAQS